MKPWDDVQLGACTLRVPSLAERDTKRAWICCYEWRGAKSNVLLRGVHPLEWLATAGARDPDLVLLWYAETSPERVELLRGRTRIEVEDATR